MEKILYSVNVDGFKKDNDSLAFMHGDEAVKIAFADVESIILESNMSAKTGAYVRIEIDAAEATLIIDSEHKGFFDVLFDIICVELDVDMEEVFNVSVANTKLRKTIYQKNKGV